jgi:hypothetical protein
MDQLKERINRLIQIAFDADPEPDDKRRAAETIGALMDAYSSRSGPSMTHMNASEPLCHLPQRLYRGRARSRR